MSETRKKKATRVTKLPDKPSALIRLALRDLEAVERMPKRYRIDMYAIHDPADDGVCEVCFAGAVMARSFKLPPDKLSMPRDVTNEPEKLWALDSFRRGFVENAFQEMDRERPDGVPPAYRVPDYSHSPSRFKASMRRIATRLAKHGH